MLAVFALVLIAIVASPVFGQRLDCTEEFFAVGRNEDNCQLFSVCLLNRRLDFFCDDGDIFDEERIQCRAGNADSCEFAPETSTVTGLVLPIAFSKQLEWISVDEKYAKQMEIIGDECENHFLHLAPHPDPSRCSEFFMCMNYNLVRFQCDSGFIYSDEDKECVCGSHETCQRLGGTPFKVMKLMKSLRSKVNVA